MRNILSPSELPFCYRPNPGQKAPASTAELQLGKGALRGGQRNCSSYFSVCLSKMHILHIYKYKARVSIQSVDTRDVRNTACQDIPEGLLSARTPHPTGKFYLLCKRLSRSWQTSLTCWHHLSKRALEAAGNRKASWAGGPQL